MRYINPRYLLTYQTTPTGPTLYKPEYIPEGSSVPVGLLYTSIPSCCTTAPAFSRSSPAGGSATSAQHVSTYGRRAFAVAGPMTFTALPDELRDPTVNTTTFRRLLKTHFFPSYLYTSSALEVKT